MTNYAVIMRAVNLAVDYFEANRITVDTPSITGRVLSWYNHTDVTDPEVLAACAINGSYSPEATYDDMLMAHEYYFPECPQEDMNIACWEIEDAWNDAQWW